MPRDTHAWLSCSDASTPVERVVEAAMHYLEAIRALPDDQLAEAADCLDILFTLWEQSATDRSK